jgi:hypothetical protein
VQLNKRAGEDRIESVEIVDRAGQRKTIRAEWFVLATGGIETTRLLLASDPQGRGFGNHNDKLGRYYACHFENLFGKLVSQGAIVTYGFEKTDDGVYCRRKLLFTPQAQRQHRLLNSMFRLHHSSYADATHGSAVMSMIYLAKSSLLPAARTKYTAFNATVGPSKAHLRNVLAGVPQLLSFTHEYLFRAKLANRKIPYTLVPNAGGNYPVEFNSEQRHWNRAESRCITNWTPTACAEYMSIGACAGKTSTPHVGRSNCCVKRSTVTGAYGSISTKANCASAWATRCR